MNTFAYAGPEVRTESYRLCRKALWALDAEWATDEGKRHVLNFARFIGGPIHLTMHRYRFVEEELTIGQPETAPVVSQASHHVKLWYRFATHDAPPTRDPLYEAAMTQRNRLLFPGFEQMLTRPDEQKCPHCIRRSSYGAKEMGYFGGVALCPTCRTRWQAYFLAIPDRVEALLRRQPRGPQGGSSGHRNDENG